MTYNEKPSRSGYTTDEAIGETDAEKRETQDKQFLALARSISASAHPNPFDAAPDSELDVHSPNFKPRAFIKSLLNLQSKDPDNFQARTAGFSFKNLNVYGFGTSPESEATVIAD